MSENNPVIEAVQQISKVVADKNLTNIEPTSFEIEKLKVTVLCLEKDRFQRLSTKDGVGRLTPVVSFSSRIGRRASPEAVEDFNSILLLMEKVIKFDTSIHLDVNDTNVLTFFFPNNDGSGKTVAFTVSQ